MNLKERTDLRCLGMIMDNYYEETKVIGHFGEAGLTERLYG